MPNLTVIFGPPASGKATVGNEVSRLTGYRLFHNHLTADPAAALFGWGTERFNRSVDAVREVLFREAATDQSLSGVIFTFVWALNVPEDTTTMERVASIFREAGGSVHFVELLADLPTRIEREGTPFRVTMKPSQRDVAAARARQVEIDSKYQMNTDGQLPLSYPHLVLDTQALGPEQVARKIQGFISGARGDALYLPKDRSED